MNTNESEQQTLDQYLHELDGPAPDVDLEFTLTQDDEWANRMLRELAVAEKKINSNSAMASAERAKITGWEASVNEPLQNRALWFRSQLEQYALHAREEGRPTVSLPFGTVSTTKKQDEWRVGPEFVQWATENGFVDMLKVERKPILNVLKKALSVDSDGNAITADGELAEGVTVDTSVRYSISIKTN